MNQENPPANAAPAAAPLSEWRQGDYVLDGCPFVHIAPNDGEAGAVDAVEDEASIGLVLVSQTCDIVGDHPHIVLCPLVEVAEDAAAHIKAGRTPQFAFIEHAPKPNIVADLSRMMTVERELVAGWTRTQGFSDEELQRKFAYALERKFGRFAFPDAFNTSIGKFHADVRKKHGKDTDIGKALETLKEIRVRATPNWDANPAEILFYFLFKPPIDPAQLQLMRAELTKLVDKIAWTDAYRWEMDSKFLLVALEDITGRDYAESVALDYYALTLAA